MISKRFDCPIDTNKKNNNNSGRSRRNEFDQPLISSSSYGIGGSSMTTKAAATAMTVLAVGNHLACARASLACHLYHMC